MNRKGFTLVEIIMVIVILALLVLVLAPNVFVLLNKNNERSCNSLINNIESAAKIYVTNNKYNLGIKCYDANDVANTTIKISLQTLIDSGDLKTDGSYKIINPVSKDEINLNTTTVTVKYNCNNNTFTYDGIGITCTK